MKAISILTAVILSSCVGISITAHAQEVAKNLDYLVLMNADTLYGKISSVKDQKLKFENQQKEKLTFEPGDIYRVYWQSKKKVYAPSYVENGLEPVQGTSPQVFQIGRYYTEEPTFAEVLVDGEIMVYYVFNLNLGGGGGMMFGTGGGGTMLSIGISKSKYAYALKKSTGEVIEISSNTNELFSNSKKKRTIALGRLINDEPELFAEFENEKKYDYDLFIKYVMRYNELQLSKISSEERKQLIIY
ncbi:hypothetical protein [Sphingobacterium multivorum]|uniref:hypothetical protein n=1 Tax=Sphingobacterium multivorum TaxID=28454 RepID=UPI0028A73928|nr:hypothetical protein [Sphingobacterium multivorum]